MGVKRVQSMGPALTLHREHFQARLVIRRRSGFAFLLKLQLSQGEVPQAAGTLPSWPHCGSPWEPANRSSRLDIFPAAGPCLAGEGDPCTSVE